mgnify:CR=1 FL=1
MKVLLTSTSFQDCAGSHQSLLEKQGWEVSYMRGPLSKGEIIGEHEVKFSSGKEILKLNHESFDRALYSEGALTAAAWLMSKKAGLYSMRDLLKFKWTKEKKQKLF